MGRAGASGAGSSLIWVLNMKTNFFDLWTMCLKSILSETCVVASYHMWPQKEALDCERHWAKRSVTRNKLVNLLFCSLSYVMGVETFFFVEYIWKHNFFLRPKGQFYGKGTCYVIFSVWVEIFFEGHFSHLPNNGTTNNLIVCNCVIVWFCDPFAKYSINSKSKYHPISITLETSIS